MRSRATLEVLIRSLM